MQFNFFDSGYSHSNESFLKESCFGLCISCLERVLFGLKHSTDSFLMAYKESFS